MSVLACPEFISQEPKYLHVATISPTDLELDDISFNVDNASREFGNFATEWVDPPNGSPDELTASEMGKAHLKSGFARSPSLGFETQHQKIPEQQNRSGAKSAAVQATAREAARNREVRFF